MAITQFDTENADRNLTSQVTCLTDTPDASNATLCIGYIAFGDGSKNLDGTGGLFELTITVGGQTVEPDPQIIYFSTATRTAVWTSPFLVPANNAVLLKAKSPNAADTDVDVTAYLYEVGGATEITSITAKLPTNYIMGSSTQSDQDTIIQGGTVPDNTSTEDSIKLSAGASGANDIYNENLVVLISGTGSGQARLIADYIGGTKTAVVRHSWITTPDNTTVYRIYPFSGILLANTGLAVAGSSSTITLNTTAPAVADIYDGHTVYISGGTGEGQARLITAYSAGRVATVYPDWDVTPAAAASVYIILPIGVGEVYDALDDVHTILRPISTTVATEGSTTSCTLTAGVATADAYNGMSLFIKDAGDSHWEERRIIDWTAGRVVTVDTAYSFTPTVGDVAYILGTAYGGGIDTIIAQTGQVHQTEDTLPGGGGTSVSASGIAEGC